MAKNHFLRSVFGSWGGFLGVLGASLYWKVVSEFWFGHPKCYFWYPQNGCFCNFRGIKNGTLGAQIKILRPQYKLAPKTPKKPPQEPKSDLKKWFLAILSIVQSKWEAIHVLCNPNWKPYTYCPGYISINNNEIYSSLVLSHWDQDNTITSFTTN